MEILSNKKRQKEAFELAKCNVKLKELCNKRLLSMVAGWSIFA
jgi:hypothetical protein